MKIPRNKHILFWYGLWLVVVAGLTALSESISVCIALFLKEEREKKVRIDQSGTWACIHAGRLKLDCFR